eukprot:3254337-Rhodomonas_salina.4
MMTIDGSTQNWLSAKVECSTQTESRIFAKSLQRLCTGNFEAIQDRKSHRRGFDTILAPLFQTFLRARAACCKDRHVPVKQQQPPSVITSLSSSCSSSMAEGVQAQAQALAGLASKAQTQEKVAAEGEIESVVSAMRDNAESGGMLRHAIKALLKLAGNAENKAKIVKEGGIEVVSAAVQKHPDLSEMGTALLGILKAETA